MESVELRASAWITEYVTPYDVYAHGITRVLFDARTEFQQAQIVETGIYGRALVLDGKWQSCTGDEFLYHEPLVQPAGVLCAYRGSPPRTALILGGGEGATLREVLRWRSIERAVMVDIDGVVVDACREHLAPMHRGAFDDPRGEVVIDDALAYVARPETRPAAGWDVIVSDLSDPIEDGPSFPLFTKEYFADLRPLLSTSGVLVVQAGPLTPADQHYHCRLHRTLREVFAHVDSLHSAVPNYPAPWSFLLASDEPIVFPAPEGVDALLATHTSDVDAPVGGRPLVAFDGTWLTGLRAVPKHIRAAIAAETEVYTKAHPPRFFGAGVRAG